MTAQIATEPGDELRAIEYGRRAAADLAEFEAYFGGAARSPAVDMAVMHLMRMRVDIIAEYIDLLETRADPPDQLIGELRRIGDAYDVFVTDRVPQGVTAL